MSRMSTAGSSARMRRKLSREMRLMRLRRTVMTRVPTFARTVMRTVTGRPAARARRAGVGSVTVTLMRLLFVSVRLTGFSLILSDPETAVPLTEIWHLPAQVTVLIGFVKRVATRYTITNRRLNIKRGIVSREVQETRLERVQNVNYNQSVYQRLMQIGDVDFDTAATDDYNFVFVGVAGPGDVVHSVDQATGVAAAGSHGLGEAQPPAPPAQ